MNIEMALPRSGRRTIPQDQSIPTTQLAPAEQSQLEKEYISPIAEKLHELDSFFLETSRRAIKLKEAKDYYNEWKTHIDITKEDVILFDAMVQNYDAGMPQRVISDTATLPYWKRSMRFLMVENEGFTGRMVLAGGLDGGYLPYPKPRITDLGWSPGISDVAKTGDILLHTIVRAARDTELIQGSTFRGLQTRIASLDAFLGDNFSATLNRAHWIPIGDRIDTLWSVLLLPLVVVMVEVMRAFRPVSRNQEGPFGVSPVDILKTRPAGSAYGSNPTITFLVCGLTLVCTACTVAAVSKSPKTSGTAGNADYYTLFSNSLMGCLSILTLMIPTIQDTHIAKQPWALSWGLAAASLLLDIAAIPLYTKYQVRWSVGAAFLASALQAFVTLQLMYTVSG